MTVHVFYINLTYEYFSQAPDIFVVHYISCNDAFLIYSRGLYGMLIAKIKYANLYIFALSIIM